MRMGIDGLSVTPEEGGFYRAFAQLVECCADFPSGHEVMVFLSRETYESLPFRPANVRFKIVRIPKRLRYWAGQFYYPYAERRYGLDVIYSPVSAAPVFSRSKKVCMVNDLSFLHTPEELTPGARLYWNHLFTVSLRRCNKISCLSEATRKDVMRFMNLNDKEMPVIYPYLDNNIRESSSDDSRVFDKHGIRGPYILYVGIFAKRKNIEGLIRAFSAIAESEPELKLVLCGKRGWGMDSIEKAIDESPVRQRIILTGFVSDAELSAIYKGASLLVLPSFMEGFGYPLIEAMSFGVLAIGSNRGSIPEIIGDERFIFDPMDTAGMVECMKLAMRKRSDRTFTEALKQRASRFSRQNTCTALKRLLLEW